MDASSRATVLSARSAVGASSLAAAAALVAVSVSTTMAPHDNNNRNTSPAAAAAASAPATTKTAGAASSWKGRDDSDGEGGGSLFPGPSPWPAEGWSADGGNDSDEAAHYHDDGGLRKTTSRPFINGLSSQHRAGHADDDDAYVDENHPGVKREIGEAGQLSRNREGKAGRGGHRGGRGRAALGSRTSWKPVSKKEQTESSPCFFFSSIFFKRRVFLSSLTYCIYEDEPPHNLRL